MRNRAPLSISLAFAFCAFAYPGIIRAQTTQDAQTSDNNIDSSSAQSVAAQMVPATVELKNDLDSKKMQPGQEFRAELRGTVHLKNGSELPGGTDLVGTIVANDMKGAGGSRLALRFTKAELKDGKAVPIEATIVDVAPPPDSDAFIRTYNYAPPSPWNGSALNIDEVGVLSGVDLHSRIAGENSGVFVSTKKNEMKLAARSRLFAGNRRKKRQLNSVKVSE